MKGNIRIVNKKAGQTPLECINELKEADGRLTHLPLTYAGRLDPLAEGVLLILIGDECLKKDEYLALPKEYEMTILFGFATDTYDVMGKIVSSSDQFSGPRLPDWKFIQAGMREDEEPDHENWSDDSTQKLQKALPKFTGRINQKYPPYSSRPVEGKPLYKWAREGKINEITIPSHEVFVESLKIINESSISGSNLLNKIKKDISKVSGDFRQEEILDLWNDVLKDKKEENYKTVTLKISCGSGVYVRGLANDIGEEIGIPILALDIKRTRVGEYHL